MAARTTVYLFPGLATATRDQLWAELETSGFRVLESREIAPAADIGVADIAECRHPIMGGVTGWQMLRGCGRGCGQLVVLCLDRAVPEDLAHKVTIVSADEEAPELARRVADLAAAAARWSRLDIGSASRSPAGLARGPEMMGEVMDGAGYQKALIRPQKSKSQLDIPRLQESSGKG